MDSFLNKLSFISNFLNGNYNITKFVSNINETICGFDDFMDFKFEGTSTISNYTIQLNNFSSYNKVTNPIELNITLGTQGSFYKISNVISVLNKYKDSTELVNIQTPFGFFIGYNITGLNFEISGNQPGCGYLECVIKLREVEISSKQFSSFLNAEEQSTTLLGKINSIRNIVSITENVTSVITTTLLGSKIIFSNRIKFR